MHPTSQSDRRRSAAAALALLLALIVIPALADPFQKADEESAAKLLTQADAYYRQGKYSLAIGTYLEASNLSSSRDGLSAAYFGLSLCNFYQRDQAGALKWMRRVMEVDPQKSVSSGFYPQAFYKIYWQARQEAQNSERAAPAAAKPSPKTESVSPPVETPSRPAPRREEPVREPDPAPAAIPPAAIAAASADAVPGGHWEVSGHYSHWTINPLLSAFKGTISDKLGNEIQNEIDKKLRQSHAGLVGAQFSPNLTIDSGGSNYGLEVRYFATGWAGTFSFGAALESTTLSLSLSGTPEQIFTNGTVANADVSAEIKTVPLFTTNFSFRWEIGRGRIRPFITLGLGFGKLDGSFSYSYTGTYRYSSLQEDIPAASVTKDFATLSQDIDFTIPKMFVILQLHLGLKIDVAKGFALLAEAGLWDGLLLRGGLAYRF
jgi:tetratricopeptide (TPR) repeat protein